MRTIKKSKIKSQKPGTVGNLGICDAGYGGGEIVDVGFLMFVSHEGTMQN